MSKVELFFEFSSSRGVCFVLDLFFESRECFLHRFGFAFEGVEESIEVSFLGGAFVECFEDSAEVDGGDGGRGGESSSGADGVVSDDDGDDGEEDDGW